jgi:signal transduction histidine kinase
MRAFREAEGTSRPGFLTVISLLTALFGLSVYPCAAAAGSGKSRLVVVLYPENNDGRPGGILVNQSIRFTFAAGSREPVEIYDEYLDLSLRGDPARRQIQIEYLRRKYAGRKIDLVIAGLATGLDYALKYRETIFPGVPIIFCAVDEREVKARKLPPDVIGTPLRFDLTATLDLALRLHPKTRRVAVIAGNADMDAFWAAQARRLFRPYEGRLQFVYLTGLPLRDLLKRVADLPERSIVYYIHVFQEGTGKVLFPAFVLEQLARVATVPIYGHVDTYVGRGALGGRVIRFEIEGINAAKLGLRILAGEKPEHIGVQPTTASTPLFDWRQMRRWGIREESLPDGSVVRFKNQGFWDLYKWQIIGVISLCLVQALLILGLLVQRTNRRQAEESLRASQREQRELTGRLLRAQETERRRIARELHDDLNQGLALLAVEMELLGQQLPGPPASFNGHMQALTARVKDLSSAVHDLSHQLHPAKLEQLGLLATVRALCKELTQSHGLPIVFSHHDLPEAIAEETALCFYRIVQEALRNAIKHSQARHAGVELSGSADTLCLRVVDDGTGFDPRTADRNGGLGLASMRERLHLVGGQITIDSAPAAGTRIEVRVPVNGTRPEDDGLQAHPANI